jgi:hypothetical protein
LGTTEVDSLSWTAYGSDNDNGEKLVYAKVDKCWQGQYEKIGILVSECGEEGDVESGRRVEIFCCDQRERQIENGHKLYHDRGLGHHWGYNWGYNE